LNAELAAMRALYAPTAADFQAQIGNIGPGLLDALNALALAPTPARCAMVAAQLRGAETLVARLRESLQEPTSVEAGA
jgi:hypothetical protein